LKADLEVFLSRLSVGLNMFESEEGVEERGCKREREGS
jgi:hypothetical protein